ncbi:MAG: Fic family protein [Candidatus Kapabacteria bacterium]|nr:Fic family protein [Candidatus Kapabacteria bacterium]
MGVGPVHGRGIHDTTVTQCKGSSMSDILHREYPHVQFRKHWNLSDRALMLLGQCEAYVEGIYNTPILPPQYAELMQVALLTGAQATTAIEGNTLSDEDIRLIMTDEKLPPSKEYQEIEVRNILDAFNVLMREVITEGKDHLVSPDLLRRFHTMIGRNLGEHFAAIPGRLREHDVVVGAYSCPDYRDVPVLIERLCAWLLQEFHYGRKQQSFSEVVIQAVVTHVYIAWIHPFGDGNGRTGRLVEFYLLLRGGNPDIASHILSNHYNMTRPEYYRQLEQATATRDLTSFIEYALLGFRDGLVQTLGTIQRSQLRTTWERFIYDAFDEIRGTVHKETLRRQRSLALELPFDRSFQITDVPNLSTPLARMYASTGDRTVRRDVERLMKLSLVVRTEQGYATNTNALRSMIAKRRSRLA